MGINKIFLALSGVATSLYERVKKIKNISLSDALNSRWLGMDDYMIKLIESGHTVELRYVSEPPHGDSYQYMKIDGVTFKGYVWGCMFLFPFNQKYVICSWMEKLYERKTIIINLADRLYHIFDEYWYDYKIENDTLILGNKCFKKTKSVVLYEIESLLGKTINK